MYHVQLQKEASINGRRKEQDAERDYKKVGRYAEVKGDELTKVLGRKSIMLDSRKKYGE